MEQHSWPWIVDWIHGTVLWAGVSSGLEWAMDGGVHECVADGGIDISMNGVLEGGKIFTVTFNLYNSGFLNKSNNSAMVLLFYCVLLHSLFK